MTMKYLLIPLMFLSIAFAQYRHINIEAISPYTDADADSSLQEINDSSGFLFSVWANNPNAKAVFLRFYDTADDTIATGAVESSSVLVFELIGGVDSTNAFQKVDFGPYGLPFQNGIKYAVMLADSTDPTSGIRLNAQYLDD